MRLDITKNKGVPGNTRTIDQRGHASRGETIKEAERIEIRDSIKRERAFVGIEEHYYFKKSYSEGLGLKKTEAREPGLEE